ncbi:MAG: EamA family transporter RarD [Deltaproteobacteria bacterium]|nr:EamA family transporter RarD [Deltaproteobacteria bacterium]
MKPTTSSTPVGPALLAAAGAFTLWGLLPLYWKVLQVVPPFEILCHRVVWSMVFAAAILTIQKRWGETLALVRPGKILLIGAAGLLLGLNWFLYILAVNTGHVLEASLGYYINPLVNVALGRVFFQERLRPLQAVAVVLAMAGVANAVWAYGRPPYLALGIAVTFAFYGLTRKVSPAKPIPGLFLETAMLALPALGFIVFSGTALAWTTPAMDLLLASTGIVTSVPLLMFVVGARRLTLTTLGLLQYIAPSLTFGLGILVFREPFGVHDLTTFVFIWLALTLYTLHGLRSARITIHGVRGATS